MEASTEGRGKAMPLRRLLTSRGAAIVTLVLAATAGCGGQPVSSTAPSAPAVEAAPPSEYEPVAAPGVESCADLPFTGGGTGSGDRLPEWTLPCLVAGPPVDLARLGGKPVLINLWATWCGPCREEMPILQNAHIRHRDKIAFLGVDTKDSPERAAAFLQEVGATYPQVVDLDGRLLVEHLRVPGLPVTVVLDAEGEVIKKHVGAFTEESLDTLIREVTGG
jgi:cytochrome c biogenesis protein CcmG/thiol:disulfide interchange protein DsbE